MYFYLFVIKAIGLSFFAPFPAKISMFLIASIIAGLKKTLIHSSKPQSRGKMGFEWSESRAPGPLRSCTGK